MGREGEAHAKALRHVYEPGHVRRGTDHEEIGEWDPVAAMRMATEIRERYNAKPYGFRFETRIVHNPVDDGEGGKLEVLDKTVAKSGIHYIDGAILKYDDVVDRPEYRALPDNMRCNAWPLAVETRNGFRWTAPFEEGDAIVNADGIVTARGTDPEHAEYRAKMFAAWRAESGAS
jgi:hypothetical protein